MASEAARSLIENLSNLNKNMDKVVDALKRVEQNEIDSLKFDYELKETLAKESVRTEHTMQNIESILINLKDRFLTEMPHHKIIASKTINSIEKIIDKKIGNLNVATNCKSCQALKVQRRVIKKLWYIVVVLGLGILALLGLNLFGVVKLPMVP